MNLSLKAVRFVIDALQHYQDYHDCQVSQPGLSEDDVADLANDRHFLAAIKQDFENYRDDLAHQRDSVKANA